MSEPAASLAGTSLRLILSVLLLGEQPGLSLLVGGALVTGGLLLTNRGG